MKSSIRLFIGTTTVGLTVLLGGCGQPGPLYLPKPPAAKPAKSGEVPASPNAVQPAPVVPAPLSSPANVLPEQ